MSNEGPALIQKTIQNTLQANMGNRMTAEMIIGLTASLSASICNLVFDAPVKEHPDGTDELPKA